MMKRKTRIVRWVMIACSVGVLPAVIMRCDKAALNFQRGLLQGAGASLGDTLVQEGLDIQVDDEAP